jgi:uncharacterized membrane protein (UPF0127 family)
MKVRITYNKKILSDDILIADNFKDRLIGLMFKDSPTGAQGLLIHPCNSIHTFFMKYALDIVFISSRDQVVKIIRGMSPWRMTWLYWKAKKTLELPAGKLPSDLKEGDFLEIQNV